MRAFVCLYVLVFVCVFRPKLVPTLGGLPSSPSFEGGRTRLSRVFGVGLHLEILGQWNFGHSGERSFLIGKLIISLLVVCALEVARSAPKSLPKKHLFHCMAGLKRNTDLRNQRKAATKDIVKCVSEANSRKTTHRNKVSENESATCASRRGKRTGNIANLASELGRVKNVGR